MGFRYQLRDPDGNDLGEAEYAFEPGPGDVVQVGGPTRMVVTAVVPIELVQEHVRRPLYGFLQVRPE
ncbi:MAG: hypothetical protein ACJ768_12810 [Gaiellaceae bacterium]